MEKRIKLSQLQINSLSKLEQRMGFLRQEQVKTEEEYNTLISIILEMYGLLNNKTVQFDPKTMELVFQEETSTTS